MSYNHTCPTNRRGSFACFDIGGDGEGSGAGSVEADGFGDGDSKYGDGGGSNSNISRNGIGRGNESTLPCMTEGTFDGQLIYQLLRPQAGEVRT